MTVGTVDEDFAVESLAGDIILLGNTSWRIRRVQAGTVLVEDAQARAPTVPFWLGEAPARTQELSAQLAEVARNSQLACGGCGAGSASSKRLAGVARRDRLAEARMRARRRGRASRPSNTFVAGRAVLGAVPTQTTVIAERFFDEGGGMQLVIHAPFGGAHQQSLGTRAAKAFLPLVQFRVAGRGHRQWPEYLARRAAQLSAGRCFQFPAHDIPCGKCSSKPCSIRRSLPRAGAGTRAASLALLRFRNGKKVPPHIQRMRADDLLASVFPEAQACQENIVGEIKIPDHPLIREVMKDVLTEAMDIEGLERILDGIAAGPIRCVAVDTPVPSQFSHEILNANPYAYLDDAPLEERRARAVEMRRVLPEAVLSEIGRLDPAAIEEVRADAWPDVRDADELHDALLTLIALPLSASAGGGALASQAAARPFLPGRRTYDALAAERRAGRAMSMARAYWVPSERAKTFAQIFPTRAVSSRSCPTWAQPPLRAKTRSSPWSPAGWRTAGR